MPPAEIAGRRAFVVESEYLLLRPQAPAPPPVVLLLHGSGDSARGFAERLALELPDAALLYAGGPLPVEQRRKDGSRGVGQVWYCYDGDQERFRDALEECESYLDGLLDAARKQHDLDPARLVVVGYSQGAYVAGFYALRRAPRPLGLALLAGRLKHEFVADRLEGLAGLPVLLAYGEKDELLPRAALDEGRRRLEEAGAAVTVAVHGGGHAIDDGTRAALRAWAAAALGPART